MVYHVWPCGVSGRGLNTRDLYIAPFLLMWSKFIGPYDRLNGEQFYHIDIFIATIDKYYQLNTSFSYIFIYTSQIAL